MGKWRQKWLGVFITIGLGMALSSSMTLVASVTCDVDGDSDVDRNDVTAIFAARNTPAAPGDPRDADGDGLITVNDGRFCVLQCTLPRCAIPPTDTTAPVVTITDPVGGAAVVTSPITVSGTIDDPAATVVVNGVAAKISNGTFTATDVSLQEGVNTLTATATDPAGNSSAVSIEVTLDSSVAGLPPDPTTVAPPLDQTVTTTMAAATEFLYTGPNPIQTGVAPGTIEPVRAAVIRGKVLDREGAPLSGVQITILNHAEFGQTLSRADGMFDLAVNGGGLLTVQYEKEDFLTAQRQVNVPWQDYVVVDDVVLIPLDPQVTLVDFNEICDPVDFFCVPPPAQVARGSVVTDEDGARQATILFPRGTTAEMVMPDGSTQSLKTLSVRATEATVGPMGPKAMPLPLPPTSAYTYAVDLSVDEARAAGATDVRFSVPVPFYVENFLGFPTGLPVPVGTLGGTVTANSCGIPERREGWLAEQNGRVIEIVSETGGLADIDIDGDGAAEDQTALAALGIDQDERVKLAELYEPGASLWRSPLQDFSWFDLNWPAGPVQNVNTGPPAPPKKLKVTVHKDCDLPGGSVLSCRTQVLSEFVSVAGTAIGLQYHSDRVAGNGAARTLEIPLTGATVPASVEEIVVTVSVAGRTFTEVFPPQPDQTMVFTWDGLDAYGREVQGAQPVTVKIDYFVPFLYGVPADQAEAFGLTCTSTLSGGRLACILPQEIATRRTARPLSTVWQDRLGELQAPPVVGAGWSLDIHHAYDPIDRVIRRGDGSREIGGVLSSVINTAAGTGVKALGRNDVDATQTALRNPRAIAVGADGSLYIVDAGSNTVRRVGPDGIIRAVAGVRGARGFSGDCGPATSARLNLPTDVAVATDGSLYIADAFNHRIRRVGPDGLITTIAGNGVSGFSGDGGPATSASLSFPGGVAVAPDGSVYIADGGNDRVRRVGSDGLITTFAGNAEKFKFGAGGDGGPATEAQVAFPSAVAIGLDGSVYIAQSTHHRVRRVTPDGIIDRFAGTGAIGSSGDGGPARRAELGSPIGLAIGPDGSLYITDRRGASVRRVGPDRIITSIAGDGSFGFSGDGGPALAAGLLCPHGVAVGPDGSMYVSDSCDHRVRRVTLPLPGFSAREVVVTSESGNETLVFDANGRHLRTLNAITGVTRWEFAYDAFGRLTGVSDGYGNTTTLERDLDGNPTAIVAPFGQRTALMVDASGNLRSIVDPAGNTLAMTYTAGGLIETFTNQNGRTSIYSYDELGLLKTAQDPGGGITLFARTPVEDGFEVTKTSPLGQNSAFLVAEDRRVSRLPDGTETQFSQSANGSSETLLSDGSLERVLFGAEPQGVSLVPDPNANTRVVELAPDPRFGLTTPIFSSIAVTTPSGLTRAQTNQRTVELADPTDPFSLTRLTDRITLNGAVYTQTYETSSAATVTLTTPEGRQWIRTFDEMGRLIGQSIPGLLPIGYQYDSQGRMISLVQGPRSLAIAFDPNSGFLSTIVDAAGREARFTYDTAGRMTSKTTPAGNTLSFDYDGVGNLVSLETASGALHEFTYDARSFRDAYRPPDSAADPAQWRDVHDGERRLTQIQRPDGTAVDFTHDPAGRLQQVVLPRGTVTRTYDAGTGRLASLTAPDGGTLTYTWDGSLLTTSAWGGPTGQVAGVVTREFNDDFKVARLLVNATEVATFAYDNDGLLVTAGELTVDRSAQTGLVTGTSFRNITTERSVNGFGELDSETYRFGASPVFRETVLERDLRGNITLLEEEIGGTVRRLAYTYDDEGQLVEVRRDGVLTHSFAYDANGNRTAVNGQIATFDARDRLIEGNGFEYTYRPDGSLASRTDSSLLTTTGYNYDALGNLMAVSLADGTQIDYEIDARDRRIGVRVDGTRVKGFLYQGGLAPVAELDGASAIRSLFVYGTRPNVPDYMVRDGAVYRIVTDHLGSVRLVIDADSGVVVQRLDYGPFGEVVSDTNPGFQPFGFVGGLYDHRTGLTRFGARDYDAGTGRWTAPDPILFLGGHVNLYVYANNDPANGADLDGLTDFEVVNQAEKQKLPQCVAESNCAATNGEDALGEATGSDEPDVWDAALEVYTKDLAKDQLLGDPEISEKAELMIEVLLDRKAQESDEDLVEAKELQQSLGEEKIDIAEDLNETFDDLVEQETKELEQKTQSDCP